VARGVSTVLDVAVCLLLVGAALATLSGIPPSPAAQSKVDADTAARTVATTTTGVPVDGRTRHGTLATQLADAAVAGATLDDRRLVETAYDEAVADATEAETDDRVFVTATWEPYPDATVSGRLNAGHRPPESADVATTTLVVDSGVDAPTASTFDALARELAAAVVDRLFPPRRTRAALVDPRTSARAATRYRTAAARLGVDVDRAVADADAAAANEALAAGLASRFEPELRDRYRTPETAAAALTADEVEIVVRRWDR